MQVYVTWAIQLNDVTFPEMVELCIMQHASYFQSRWTETLIVFVVYFSLHLQWSMHTWPHMYVVTVLYAYVQYMAICIYIYMYLCIYVYIYLCIFIFYIMHNAYIYVIHIPMKFHEIWCNTMCGLMKIDSDLIATSLEWWYNGHPGGR